MICNTLLNEKNLWVYLKNTTLPIVIYGMGNGADKIIEVLDANGIEVADFFASDGFVRGHSFHGKRVLSFSEVKEKYEKFIILLAFGSSLSDVMARFYDIADHHELYAPDVPVCGGELFDADFYLENEDKFAFARSLLADEKSKDITKRLINLEEKLTVDVRCYL